MLHLIDAETQRFIASRIDAAVASVLAELNNHGSEEGLTPALGHTLRQQSFQESGVQVKFNYRQLSKYTEEPTAGADGGFVVSVTNADGTVRKAALFQAKLLRGALPVRSLSMSASEADRLQKQAADMLSQTNDAVALFYTHRNAYVVDASDYSARAGSTRRTPLSKEHRLITLGTYLGAWIPRCTKGDRNSDLSSRIEHVDGFKQGLSMDIVTTRPSIAASPDKSEAKWQVVPVKRRKR